jgi:Flp pilus assembly protein TadD
MRSFKAGALAPNSSVTAAQATAIFARDREAARAAILRFTRRLRVQGEDAEAWHALGAALIRLGDRPAACAAFRNAVQLDRGSARSHRALGNLLFDCGQLDHALRCFEMMDSR